MRKIKNNNKSNPEPYEDIIRLEQLDPYEALIKSNNVPKNNHQST